MTRQQTHTLFIADLHLSDDNPAITQAFFAFLTQRAPDADALYILGDLFNVWLGDDDNALLCQQVIQRLNALVQQGVPVYFMRGNRDVLIGQGFIRDSGCTLLEEPYVIDLYGCPTVLVHGDSLCLHDTLHRVFRWVSHKAVVQRLALATPLRYRKSLLLWLRKKSQARVRTLAPDKMDVDTDAVKQLMLKLNVRQMIHGHTHKPALHTVSLGKGGGDKSKRFVLGDWGHPGIYALCYNSDGSYHVLTDTH